MLHLESMAPNWAYRSTKNIWRFKHMGRSCTRPTSFPAMIDNPICLERVADWDLGRSTIANSWLVAEIQWYSCSGRCILAKDGPKGVLLQSGTRVTARSRTEWRHKGGTIKSVHPKEWVLLLCFTAMSLCQEQIGRSTALETKWRAPYTAVMHLLCHSAHLA